MNLIETVPLDNLLAEKRRLSGCFERATDTFSKMLLTGQLKSIEREIERRHINAAIAERI